MGMLKLTLKLLMERAVLIFLHPLQKYNPLAKPCARHCLKITHIPSDHGRMCGLVPQQRPKGMQIKLQIFLGHTLNKSMLSLYNVLYQKD